jgi:DNA-binding NtrC family response regulator
MARRVLLAEDNPSLSQALTQVLARAGFDVTRVRDGTAALAQLARRAFDALVCDILLPGSNGLEILQQAPHVSPGLPVILMTGGDDPGLEELASKLNAFAFLRKPVRAEELVDCLNKALA